MQYVMARAFGVSKRPDLNQSVVGEVLAHIRSCYPSIMTKNEKGWWVFPDTHEKLVMSFLMDKSVVEEAEKKVAMRAGYSAGRRRGKKEAIIRVMTTAGEIIDVSLDEAEAIIQSMTNEIERLTVENQVLKGAKNNTPIPQTNNVVQFPYPAKKNKNAISQMAQFISANPGLAVGCKTKDEMRRKYCAAANAAGLRTVTGKPWNVATLNNYRKEIEPKIAYLIDGFKDGRFSKPRIRVQAGKR